jgi:hypothetical protein
VTEGNAAENLESVPNHSVDPETGFIESNAYAIAFDAQRKQQFLQLYKANGLGLYRTCKALGISHHTINKHYKNDQAFKKAFDEAMEEYADELEAVSRQNALNPRSVIERIFQLKSLLPGKYADQRVSSAPQVNITIDAATLSDFAKRVQSVEAQPIEAEVLPPSAPERPL